jgi:hypothetical protein
MVAALNLKVSKTQTGPKPGSKSGAKKAWQEAAPAAFRASGPFAAIQSFDGEE